MPPLKPSELAELAEEARRDLGIAVIEAVGADVSVVDIFAVVVETLNQCAESEAERAEMEASA